jgi:photosystem II stability/assembly factor-like uncharacterized protein
MRSPRSKVRWATAVAAIMVLGVAGFLIGRHDAGGGAQARPAWPSYEPEQPSHEPVEGGSDGPRSAGDHDLIDDAELVGPEEGWALTTSRLAWTTDGGDSWTTITPPDIATGSILAVRFDGSGDGVVVACQEINAGSVPLEFFRTTDDGRSWQTATFDFAEEGPGSIGTVWMSEADGVWWLLVDEAGHATTGQRLYRSEEAGMSWQEAGQRPPASGPFVFFSSQEGWIIGGGEGTGMPQVVYRTVNAGESWEEVQVPMPSEGDGREVRYGLPERSAEGVQIPVTTVGPTGESEVRLYERSDAGAWKVLSTTELARTATSEAATTFVAPGELLIQEPTVPAAAVSPAITKVSTRSDAAGSPGEDQALATRIGRATGLPEPLPLQFVDRSHGVAVQAAACRASGCSEEAELFMTSDGGRTWSPSPTQP